MAKGLAKLFGAKTPKPKVMAPIPDAREDKESAESASRAAAEAGTKRKGLASTVLAQEDEVADRLESLSPVSDPLGKLRKKVSGFDPGRKILKGIFG